MFTFGNSSGLPSNILVKGNEITNNYAADVDPQLLAITETFL